MRLLWREDLEGQHCRMGMDCAERMLRLKCVEQTCRCHITGPWPPVFAVITTTCVILKSHFNGREKECTDDHETEQNHSLALFLVFAPSIY